MAEQEPTTIICAACGSDAYWADGIFFCERCGYTKPVEPVDYTPSIPIAKPLSKDNPFTDAT